ncbi:MAG: hypothetical protein K9L24_04860, partial [Spirochaetia bacterium]|nr:hypothetical protein [Spirochaetia bacterium]
MKRISGLKSACLGLLIVMILSAAPIFAAGQQEGTGTVRVTYIPITSGIPYFDPIIEGMREAVEKQGGEFSMIAPNEVSPT